ncbi:hypothetical protein Hdeb2414_s0066g00767821 [Helianthus debilis subsp. tardiflorus]
MNLGRTCAGAGRTINIPSIFIPVTSCANRVESCSWKGFGCHDKMQSSS